MDEWMVNNDPGGSSFGNLGSTDTSAAADNSGNVDNTQLTDLNYKSSISDPSLLDKVTGVFKNAQGGTDWGKVATALGGVYGAATAGKGLTGGAGAGYQGGIPTLYAGRNMLTAPPTMVGGKPRRPGSGGIDYGGDVTYFNTKAEVDAQKAAAAAAANAITPGGTNTVTPGGTNTVTPGGTNNKTGGANPGSAGYQAAIAAGLTPQQYLGNINQWIIDHPYASKDQIAAAMAEFKVSDVDLQTALGETNFSDATKYSLTHGSGLAELNSNISNWIEQHPYATNEQIQAEMAKTGVNDEDVARAMTGLNSSAAKEWAVVHDMGLDQLYENILDYQRADHTPEEIAAMKAASGVSQADIDAAQKYAITNKYAEGGMAEGRYLQGGTDGMADELPAQIGNDQPAALSHGEFVIPADVVSHMGNGNSDAGAKKLYQMMDKIRMARTGTKKQGKKINPDKFMPGGLANSKYAKGGKVKHFEVGGTTGAGSAVNAGVTGIESNLSNWAGPYVTNMLGQGQALANMPYQAYTGQLTAGESPLQTQAFTSAGGLSTPTGIATAGQTAGDIATKAQGLSYTPTTSSFDTTQAQSYMNPYLDAALKPQLDEARRQSQITQQTNAAKMTQAGAFGGGRSAILEAENQRNLGTNLAGITGTGYNTAYDKAMAQFNADQNRKAQESQFGATYGLQGLQTGLQAAQTQGALGTQENQADINNMNAQLTAGNAQRGIESEGIAADKAQFEEARANPYKMVQFQQSLLQGLPLASQAYNTIPQSSLVTAAKSAKTVDELMKILGL